MGTLNPEERDREWRNKACESVTLVCRRRYPELDRLPERPWFLRNKLVGELTKQVLLERMVESKRLIDPFAGLIGDYLSTLKIEQEDIKVRLACLLRDNVSAMGKLKSLAPSSALTSMVVEVEGTEGLKSSTEFEIRVKGNR
jgi:hypothetical protein